MKQYRVKEIFDTIQGEGIRSGTRAIFVRFAGCHLWSGHEAGRAKGKGPCAKWCDTDFVGGEMLSAVDISQRCRALWPTNEERWIVLTGGEPALQIDRDLTDYLKRAGWRLALETSGTKPIPTEHLDHITVSPKLGLYLAVRYGTECKAVVGPDDWTGETLERLRDETRFTHHIVQPRDNSAENIARCVDIVRRFPRWRLGLQVHKLIGVA